MLVVLSTTPGFLRDPKLLRRVRLRVLPRVLAKGIDLFLYLFSALLFSLVLPYPIAAFLGFLYTILGDGMRFGPFQGQSIGKRIIGLQVTSISLEAPGPVSWKQAAIRNAPVGVATFFGAISVWGWIISILVGVPLLMMEVYLMLSVESGHRLGDVMAETEVVRTRG